MFQEKQFYLEQLKDGPLGHRKIMNRMAAAMLKASSAAVRDELIAENKIEVVRAERIGKTQKMNYFFQLVKHEVKPVLKTTTIEACWPDGWPKSSKNAFDWRNNKQSSFSKAEISNLQQKYSKNPQVIVYSRA